jgi:hypothetical protein
VGWVIAGRLPDKKFNKMIADSENKGSPPGDMSSDSDFSAHTDDEERALSTHDRLAMKMVDESITRTNDFKFQLAVPFKHEKPHMPDNFGNALYRLRSQQRSLERDETLKMKYIEKIKRLKQGRDTSNRFLRMKYTNPEEFGTCRISPLNNLNFELCTTERLNVRGESLMMRYFQDLT